MPADLNGMRIRVLPSEVQARTFELLGAVPVRCDLTEAIAGIKAGTLDAQENPFANTVTYGVHKFHHFHTVTNHFYISRPIFLHRPSFDGWPQDLQSAMRDAIKQAVTFQREQAIEEDREARLAIEAAGCEIGTLTAAEHGQFRAAVGALLDESRKIYGQKMFDLTTATLNSASPLVGLRKDQRPEHFVFRLPAYRPRRCPCGSRVELSILARCGGKSRQPEKASASV